MNKPVIGITGNEKAHPDDELMMSYAAKGFVEGVKEAGGIPIILPIGDEEMASYYISLIDKLILTGGQNVDPKYYGEPKVIDSDDYHLQRDIFELALIKEAIKQNKPIFSVCRGTQLFNVAMGGSLYQDIDDHWQDTSDEYTTQRLVTEPDTVLREIYGEISHINSFHHQSIKDLAPNLQVVAHDPKDGIIEAVEAENEDGIFVMGVQFHPEMMFDKSTFARGIFKKFINICIDSRPAEVILKNEIHHIEEHEEKNIDEKIKEFEDEEKKEFFRGDL